MSVYTNHALSSSHASSFCSAEDAPVGKPGSPWWLHKVSLISLGLLVMRSVIAVAVHVGWVYLLAAAVISACGLVGVWKRKKRVIGCFTFGNAALAVLLCFAYAAFFWSLSFATKNYSKWCPQGPTESRPTWNATFTDDSNGSNGSHRFPESDLTCAEVAASIDKYGAGKFVIRVATAFVCEMIFSTLAVGMGYILHHDVTLSSGLTVQDEDDVAEVPTIAKTLTATENLKV